MSGMNHGDGQEPEYATRRIRVRREDDISREPREQLLIDLVVCTRCGSYVWDLQAHEKWHGDERRRHAT